MSVIVPVRNGREDLRILLDCLRQQTLPPEEFEIVIADDGSTDGGTDGLGTSDGHIRVVLGAGVNAYAARNQAVAASSATFLAFCDADCRPEPAWLERGIAALDDADVVAGRIRFRIPSRPSVWSLLDAETTKDHARQVLIGNAETANLFIRRSLYDQVGPFDSSQPGFGDFEFVQRCVSQGAKLVFAPEVVVSHPVRTSARDFLRNVWLMNISYGSFETRSGRTPEGIRLREWIPLMQTVRSRRRFELSPGIDRRWLRENNYSPRLQDDIKAAPITYLLLPYLRSTAQLVAWLHGRRDKHDQDSPAHCDAGLV